MALSSALKLLSYGENIVKKIGPVQRYSTRVFCHIVPKVHEIFIRYRDIIYAVNVDIPGRNAKAVSAGLDGNFATNWLP